MKQIRRRGVILTTQGLSKLNQAKYELEIEQNFRRYTLESLSEKTGLSHNTLSKIFTGSVGVDKRTLECCFRAFNLTLLPEDYLYLKAEKDDFAKIPSMIPAEIFCSIEPAGDRHLETLPQTLPEGQIPLKSVFYIDHPRIKALCYHAIQHPGTTINIRAPKQMGKTSLMMRILNYAKTLNYHIISLNLHLADSEILQDIDRFLKWFCTIVSKQLGITDYAKQIAEFWDMSLGSKSNATDYFEQILLANRAPQSGSLRDRPLVMAIDELSELFAYPNIAREFLQLLRVWSEKAREKDADRNPWYKLRQVTVRSTEILLPPSFTHSLLNWGLVIQLPEFTPAQVQDLAQRWEQEITEQQIEQLITLVGGHPYRLQLAFYSLQQKIVTLSELLECSEIALAIYAEHLQQQWWNLQRYPDLWKVFRQILRDLSPVDCEVEQCYQLQRIGLVHLQGHSARLACELFRPFFSDRLKVKLNK